MNRTLYQLSYAAICRNEEYLPRNSRLIIPENGDFVKSEIKVFPCSVCGILCFRQDLP